jgi:hypothetical protein
MSTPILFVGLSFFISLSHGYVETQPEQVHLSYGGMSSQNKNYYKLDH